MLSTPRNKAGSASTGPGALFMGLPGDWNFGRASAAGGAAALAGAGTAEQVAAAVASAHRSAQIGAAYYTPRFPNADGSFDIVLDNPDYNAAGNDTDVGVRFTLRPFRPSNDVLDANPLTDIVIDSETNGVEESAILAGAFGTDVVVGAVIFSDDPSDAHSASAESESYRLIAGSRTPNTVTVKVVDQYGDPLRNVDISVNSDLDDVDRETDSEGEAGTEKSDR